MTGLLDSVSIERRFARSIRLDADLGQPKSLAGYVIQSTVERALTSMAESQIETRQGAFTWTGPYGGGKSSAALLFASYFASDAEQARAAKKLLGRQLASKFDEAFARSGRGWAVVPITGRRSALKAAIAEAATRAFCWSDKDTERALASDDSLIELLEEECVTRDGVILIVDELGKLLEHEAASGGDAHILQDLAERASRSHGRLVLVGILHQAFSQYSERSSRSARREWMKVQGRFQDIPFLPAVDEGVALLGRAIRSAKRPKAARNQATATASSIAVKRPTDIDALASALELAWPLNPLVSILLGPVSRQRFAQNERSVFGFLSSAEPRGFQDFLRRAQPGQTYDPYDLWDYLTANFGLALTSGPDGSRFSLAQEAIERSGSRGGDLHVAIAKSASLIELFGIGTGVDVSDHFLSLSIPWASKSDVAAATADLVDWAVLLRRQKAGGYALFAGSDFDLDSALERATSALSAEEMAALPARAGFASVAAKRHYFETGALRTFEIATVLVSADDDKDALRDRVLMKQRRSSGIMILFVNDGSLTQSRLEQRCEQFAAELHSLGHIGAVGCSKSSFQLRSDAEELYALERVLRQHPQLEGDRIARREISARISACIDRLHQSLEASLESARWQIAGAQKLTSERPSVVASEIADSTFPLAPILRSELLQRDRPSSNAMAALRNLCHAMVKATGEADLAFTGFPPEMGLLLTVLRPFDLHRQLDDGSYGFADPGEHGHGQSLLPAWNVLKELKDGTLEGVFERWARPPFGMKLGIMAPLALAFMLAHKDTFAIYVDETFQAELDDFVVDRLLQKPGAIRLKRIDRTVEQTAFLSGLAQLLGQASTSTPLTVAQAVFRRFTKLTQYAKRTSHLDVTASAIRDVILKAKDPEALLFEDLPRTKSSGRLGANDVYAALEMCEECYPNLLTDLKRALSRALGCEEEFAGVARRAAAVRGLTNDFAFDAFALRAAAFDGGDGDIEGLASLLVHKSPSVWSDRDREQAFLELARYGRRFREAEALATVRERRSNTEALALVVGIDPKVPPLLSTFELTDQEKLQASALADELLGRLAEAGHGGHLRLAALARAVASLAGEAA